MYQTGGRAPGALVFNPPLLRSQEFYRAGTAPPGLKIPGSATDCEWTTFLRQMLTIAKAGN